MSSLGCVASRVDEFMSSLGCAASRVHVFPWMCGFIAQLVEHRTGIAELTGSNPVEALALIFFRLLLSNCFIKLINLLR